MFRREVVPYGSFTTGHPLVAQCPRTGFSVLDPIGEGEEWFQFQSKPVKYRDMA